jgi:hypothetical protein
MPFIRQEGNSNLFRQSSEQIFLHNDKKDPTLKDTITLRKKFIGYLFSGF